LAIHASHIRAILRICLNIADCARYMKKPASVLESPGGYDAERDRLARAGARTFARSVADGCASVGPRMFVAATAS
jgi:hypothetical protein